MKKTKTISATVIVFAILATATQVACCPYRLFAAAAAPAAPSATLGCSPRSSMKLRTTQRAPPPRPRRNAPAPA
jgi:hypothetical protein